MKGVPLIVTVFATNGRGNGESVSELAYIEEDGVGDGDKTLNIARGD